MNAEQQRQLEKTPSSMDSIALEALSSMPAAPAQPGLELDDTRSGPAPRDVQFSGLNQDTEAEPNLADTGGERIDEYCDRHRLDVRSRHRVVHPGLQRRSCRSPARGHPRQFNAG